MKLNNRFIIIIPLYNAKDLIESCLMSILTQTYDDLGIIIRDDMSTDGTDKVVKNLLGNQDDKFMVSFMGKDVLYIKNTSKFYPIGNTYDSVMKYVDNNNSIIGVVDGDDMLSKRQAVSTMVDIYDENPDKWLVWSQHRSSDGSPGQSKPLPSDEVLYSSRNYWSVTHFRTCKKSLYHKLDIKDLMDPFTGEKFSSFAGDAAFLFPFIEMCGNEHSYFLDEVLYHYNNDLPTNEHNKDRSNAVKYGSYFKHKGIKYKKLESL
jgi:glycosyltransferase involved in cell wall biosynthesis|tara:strand:+ start:60 stop:845 length:786 start_codon:yes stop_codon:yes gene_type:complete